MGIPQEDLGPQSLRNYGFTDFGDIAANIEAMEEFASRLAADVQKSYVPHMERVTKSMGVQLPEPVGFPELHAFLTAHRSAQEVAQNNIYQFAGGTEHFATAATDISKKYRGADAFARAKVSDVDTAFTKIATQSTDPSAQGDA